MHHLWLNTWYIFVEYFRQVFDLQTLLRNRLPEEVSQFILFDRYPLENVSEDLFLLLDLWLDPKSVKSDEKLTLT